VYPRLFQIGPASIPTFGVLSALGLLAALGAAQRFARRLELPSEKIWNLNILAILTSLIGARLLLVATHFAEFRTDPYWVLGLIPIHSAWIGYAAAGLGAAAGLLYLLAEGLPLRRTLDALAPALALGLGVQAIGAFLGGARYGVPTLKPWAVEYHSILSTLWYHTPLNLPLQPVQLYDAGVCLVLFAALAWWLPRRTQDGEVAGLWLLAYGAARFLIEIYRGDTSAMAILTGVQWLCVAAVVLGAMLLWRRNDASAGGAS
jgi:phosphatidylglycerol---prolipoprotein diacylglyceryl transferase